MARPVTSWLPNVLLSPLNGRAGRRKKLALVGASRPPDGERPPLDDPSWDVWGCNSLWKLHLDTEKRLRASAWWEMHPLSAQTPQELQDMYDCPVPLYVLGDEESELADHWITYPFTCMHDTYGQRGYYTCTFAYQIALALTLSYEEIGLYGVELQGGSVRERRIELPCLTYWLGLAIGRGIKITLPDYSQLLWHEHLYGYDYDEDVQQSKIDDQDLFTVAMKDQCKLSGVPYDEIVAIGEEVCAERKRRGR